MSDIFREVDEDVRKDQMLQLWRRYGPTLLITIGIIVIAVAGWQFYEMRRESALKAAGGVYAAAEENATDLSGVDKAALFGGIADDLEGGFATLARLREAAAYLEVGRRDEAVAVYDALAADGSLDSRLSDLAGILAAEALADHITPEELEARVAPFAVAGRPFAALAKELLVVAALERGDQGSALALANELLDEGNAPQGLTSRMNQVRDLLQARVDQGIEAEPTAPGETAGPAEEEISLPVTISPSGDADQSVDENAADENGGSR